MGIKSDICLAIISLLEYASDLNNRLAVSDSTPINEQEIPVSNEEMMTLFQVQISFLRCLPNVSEDCDGGIFSNLMNAFENFMSKGEPSELDASWTNVIVALESVYKAHARSDTFHVQPFANAGRTLVAFENEKKVASNFREVLAIEGLDMFDSALLKPYDGSADVWPSWIPDWRRPQLRAHIFPRTLKSEFSDTFSVTPAYSASGHDPKVFTSLIGTLDLATIKDYELHLHGFQVDTIRNLTGLNLENYNPNSNLKLFLDEQDILPFDMEDLYHTGETVSDAFLRTIHAGVVITEGPAHRRVKDSDADLRNLLSGTSTGPSYICYGRQFSVTSSNAIGLVPKLA